MAGADLANLFVVTFILGLGGAISPGTLLTYTIMQAVPKGKQAWKTGIRISLGHATIEIVLILLLLVGIGSIFQHENVFLVIGVVGGVLLAFFGGLMLADLVRRRVDISFLKNLETPHSHNGGDSEVFGPQNIQNSQNIHTSRKSPTHTSPPAEESKSSDLPTTSNRKYLRRPFFASMVFLMSNPYWWLWWATIGLSIMIENGVTFAHPLLLVVFIAAKELGQFLWFPSIALAVGSARHLLTRNIYFGILGACALFMVGYGIYLGVSPFLTL